MNGGDEQPTKDQHLVNEPVELKESITLNVGDTESVAPNVVKAPQEVASLQPLVSSDQCQAHAEKDCIPQKVPYAQGASTDLAVHAPIAALPPTLDSVNLPGMAVGVLTASLAFVSLLVIFVCYADANSSIPDVPQDVSPKACAAFIAFSIAHIAWFCKSQATLLKYTGQLVPVTGEEKNHLFFVRCLLPGAWLTLFCIYCTQFLFLSQYPMATALPWILAISLSYWIISIVSFPLRLKRLYEAETAGKPIIRQEGSEVTGFSLFSSFSGRSDLVTFPRFNSIIALLPFWSTPYIRFWKMSVIAIHNERMALKRRVRKSTDRLVIRYRKYALLERWLRQRYAGGGWRKFSLKKKILVVACVPLIGALVFFEGSLLVNVFAPLVDLVRGHAANGVQASQAGATVSANHTILAFLGWSFAALLLVIFLKIRWQPSHYEFTQSGFRNFRFRGNKKIYGALTDWSRLQRIRIIGGRRDRQGSASALEFQVSGGKDLKLQLDSIESVEDREGILQAIELWAPAVGRDPAVMQVLQPPVDHSYTELWLQALAAPPQRDRLKPLIENALVNDGRYKVIGSLGVGGQGAAYQATDLYSGDTVVLKEFLLPIYVDVSIRKEVLERFESEARILKHLDHPQVVKLSEYFVEDHRAYLVLEHIDGLSLRDTVLKNGPLTESRVLELAKQMCTILEYLHIQAPPVVHRDFTPENLILRNDGLLKLIDFNVAKQVESTATGSVVGKPAYLPPEQFRGQPVSQSDIYGMGATLYFLLVGEDPEPISVSHPQEKVFTLSAALDEIVARATAIDLKDRYASADQLLHDLEGAELAALADQARPNAAQHWQDREQDYAREANQNGLQNPRMAQAPAMNIFKFSSAEPAKARQFRLVEADESANEEEPVVGRDQAFTSNPSGSTATEPKPTLVAQGDNVAANKSFWRRLNMLLAPSKRIGLLTSWLTIALAFTWLAFPGAPGWFDPDREYHYHLKAAEADGFMRFSDEANSAYESEMKQCIALKPNCAYPYLRLGEFYSYHDHPKKAVFFLEKAVKLEPNKQTWRTLADNLEDVGSFAEAVSAGKAAVAAPEWFGFVRNIPVICDWDTLARMRDLATDLNIAFAYLNLGDEREALAEIEKAESACRAVQRGPLAPFVQTYYTSQIEPHFYTASAIAWEESHDPDQAIHCLEKVEASSGPGSLVKLHIAALKRVKAELMQDRTDQRAMGAAWAVCEGLAYNGLGDFKKSQARLTEAIGLKPDYADSYVWRAEASQWLGEIALANGDLEKILALEPDNLHGHLIKAMLLRQSAQYEKCNIEYEKIDKIVGSDLTIMNRGRNLLLLGKFDRALDLFDSVARSEGRFGPGRLLKGVAELKLKRYAAAYADIKLGSSNYRPDKFYYYQGLAAQASGDDHLAGRYLKLSEKYESDPDELDSNGHTRKKGRANWNHEWFRADL